MKKLLSIILAVGMVISTMLQVVAAPYAHNDKMLYEEYLSLVKEGAIGQDVDFETWAEAVKESEKLEKELLASTEFDLVYDSSNDEMAGANAAYVARVGDVFITNATSFGGITGHSAMLINESGNLKILHISGSGATPTVITISSWHTKYTNSLNDTWTRIYRHSSSTVASQAATWERNTYKNSGAKYVLNTDLVSTNETYCSKMVWQAYYYGPSSPAATYYENRIVTPYGIPSAIPSLSLNTTVYSDAEIVNR